MKFEWTEQALEGFRNIRSHYYTPYETAEYKKRLLENIQTGTGKSATNKRL